MATRIWKDLVICLGRRNLRYKGFAIGSICLWKTQFKLGVIKGMDSKSLKPIISWTCKLTRETTPEYFRMGTTISVTISVLGNRKCFMVKHSSRLSSEVKRMFQRLEAQESPPMIWEPILLAGTPDSELKGSWSRSTREVNRSTKWKKVQTFKPPQSTQIN